MSKDIKRGDIWYINNDRGQRGHEIKKDRPAIIVSCDANNKHSDVVTVVFLTSRQKKDTPTHVTIKSTGRKSEALCEQPTSIDIRRIVNFLCRATDEEMQRIEAALMIGLGIDCDTRLKKTMDE